MAEISHQLDNWNKLKNLSSKEIGEKMKKKESIESEEENISREILNQLETLNSSVLQTLSVTQIKKLRILIDEQVEICNKDVGIVELQSNEAVKEIANLLYNDVPISNDEDENGVERTYGDVKIRKKYSHVNLNHIIDGMYVEKGEVNAGAGGYYLEGPAVFLKEAVM